jgi:hypothetical protein
MQSDGDHFKIFLACTALWTSPIHGNVFPQGSRGNAMFWRTLGFIVNPAANQAHPGFRIVHSLSGLQLECKLSLRQALQGCHQATDAIKFVLSCGVFVRAGWQIPAF